MTPRLLRDQTLIDGIWTQADDGSTFPVTDPATGVTIARVPAMGAAETRRAIAAADRAWPDWRALTAVQRAAILRRWHDLMLAAQDDLAQIMTAEQGKPLAEARGEIAYAASYFAWFAEEGRRVYGELIPPHQADRRLLVMKQPVGVCAAITPWNFPTAMIARKAAAALAAGCTLVVKPAEETPLSALALAVLGGARGAARGGVQSGHRGARGHRRRTERQSHRPQAQLYRLHRGRATAHAPVRRDGEAAVTGTGR